MDSLKITLLVQLSGDSLGAITDQLGIDEDAARLVLDDGADDKPHRSLS